MPLRGQVRLANTVHPTKPKPCLRKRGMKQSSVVTTMRMARPIVARPHAGVVMALAATVAAVRTGAGVAAAAAAAAAVSAAATAAAAACGSIGRDAGLTESGTGSDTVTPVWTVRVDCWALAGISRIISTL